MIPVDREQKENKVLYQPPVHEQIVFSRYDQYRTVSPLETPFKLIIYDQEHLQTWVSDRHPKSGRLKMIRQDDTVSPHKCPTCAWTVYHEHCIYARNDKMFHVECFRCNLCKESRLVKNYTNTFLHPKVDAAQDKDDKIYHRSCYELRYPSPKESLANCLADSKWVLEWPEKPANDHAATTNTTDHPKNSVSGESQACEQSGRRDLIFRSDGKLSDNGVYQGNTWRVREDDDIKHSVPNSVFCQDIAGLGSYVLTFDSEYLHFTGHRVAQQVQQPSSGHELIDIDTRQTVTGYRLAPRLIDLTTPTGFDPIPLDRY